MKRVLSPASCLMRALLVVFGLVFSTGARAQTDAGACGDLRNAYGPLDYRTMQGPKIAIVEQFHFTPEVEALVRGKSGSLGADLSYTLRAIPNHPRALLAMMRLALKTQNPQPPDAAYSVDCFFQRALRFKPEDTVARLLYANYLTSTGRATEAVQHIEKTEQYAGDNGFTHYNMGLAYFDAKQYTKALEQAHKAVEMGVLQTALREKLVSVGQWRETMASTPDTPATTIEK